MVLLRATDHILTALEAVPASCREELELPATLELHGPIAHEQLLRLSKHLKQDAEYNTPHSSSSQNPTILSYLLRGTKVYVPPPPKKPEPVRSTGLPKGTPSNAASLTYLVERGIPRLQVTSPCRSRTSRIPTPSQPNLHPRPRPRRPLFR